MNFCIDKQKILDYKKNENSPLLEAGFNDVCENQNPLDIIKFVAKYRSFDRDTILENITSLAMLNSDSSFSFMNTVLETAEFSEKELTLKKNSLNDILNKIPHSDEIHIDRINKSIKLIESKIDYINDMDVIREEMLMNLAVDRIKRSCLFESYLENDLEVLIYNINTSPETISEYEKIIRKIKVSNSTEYFSSYPTLLIKNTELIRNLTVTVSGDVLELLTCMPTVIADKLVHSKLSNTVLNSYIKIYDKQMAILYQDLKNNDSRKYNIYRTYLTTLSNGKVMLMNSRKAVKESFGEDMGPDLYLYDEGIMEDLVAELEDSLADIFFDPSEEIDMGKMENFTRIYRTLEATSNAQKSMIKAGHKAGDATRGMVNKAKEKSLNAKRATLPIKKSLEPISNALTNAINKLKDLDKKERTERIITGGRVKLSTLIRRGIMALGVATAGVVGGSVVGKVAKGALTFTAGHLGGVIIAAIALLTATALDKKADRKQRQLILADLENELKITEEKIEDAKSDGARKEKYELMRIQNKLKKDIERIRYNLD